MIAIDTNVLLRYLLQDHPEQSKKAEAVVCSNGRVFLSDVVLSETIWTLTGKRYRFDKERVSEVVRGLLGDNAFEFEDIRVVWTALRTFEDAKVVQGKALGFIDSLVVAKSHAAIRNAGQRRPVFYSFDTAVQQLSGTRLL